VTDLPEPELRPEEPRRRPSTLGGAIYIVVALTTAAGLAAVAADSWRVGLTVMGGALLAGSVARLVLADDNAGMLKVRRKSLDVLFMALLGAALVTLAIVVPNTTPV
jgi:hypothetical protein